MRRSTAWLGLVAAGFLAACASSGIPTQRMADAEAAAQSARDHGASATPQGQLHLALADEQIAHAKRLIASGDNDRAAYALIRAKADADLAVVEGQATTAENAASDARKKIEEARAAAASTTTTSVTTTTSGTVPVFPAPSSTSSTTTTTTTTGGKP